MDSPRHTARNPPTSAAASEPPPPTSPAAPGNAAKPAPGESGHLGSLDGLRGMAAVIVVVTHCLGALDRTPSIGFWIYQTPLRILTAPAGAVQVFFALSGFVLALSLERRRVLLDTPLYYVRRVLRIQPPYMFAVLFAWLLSFLYVEIPEATGLKGWFHSYLPVHLSGAQLGSALLFPGNARGQLPVGWSLYVEMIFSFLMPVFCLVARRLHWSLLLPLLVYAWFGAPHFPVLRWSFDFVFGMVIYLERDRLAAVAARTPGVLKLLFFILTLALFAWPTSLLKTPPEILRVAVGSGFFVIAALWIEPVRRFFETRPMTELGRVSYSLYLVHFPILLALGPWLVVPESPSASVFTVTFGVVLTSLVAAELAWRAVERPSMQLGRALSRARARSDRPQAAADTPDR